MGRASIVIPAYRCAAFLPQALDSLLAQTHADWEAIVVDDGSPDESAGIAEDYSRRDARIRLVRQTNAGACAARNRGIAQARGDYLLFLDADDWLESTALSTLLAACETGELDAAHGTCRLATPQGEPTLLSMGLEGHQDLFLTLSDHNPLAVHGVLVKRALMDEIGVFDPVLRNCGDWDLWGRLARSQARVGRVDATVGWYRMSRGTLSRHAGQLLADGLTTLRRLHASDPRVTRPQARYAQGADVAHLGCAMAKLAIYAAAGCGANADAARELLAAVPVGAAVPVEDIAILLMHAACRALCMGPDQIALHWPRVLEHVAPMMPLVAQRMNDAELPERALARLRRLLEPFAVPAAWIAVRDYLRRAVLPRLELRPSVDDAAAHDVLRCGVCVGTVPTEALSGSAIMDALDHGALWMLFLQEVWGTTALAGEALYAASCGEPGVTVVEQFYSPSPHRVDIEVLRPLTEVRGSPNIELDIHVTLGGMPVGRIRAAAPGGRASAQALRGIVNKGLRRELILPAAQLLMSSGADDFRPLRQRA